MSAPTRSVSRYQRRILAWGAGLTCLLYVIGAPFYVDGIETDLTERVSAELAAAGFDGVSVSFSGQTGSITCASPLGNPREALDVAYDVRGVRSMEELPDECRVLVEPPAVVEPDDQATTTTAPEDTSTTTTMPEVPDFESVLAVLSGNPQFSLLDRLFDDAGISAELSSDEPVTLFAPTDSAFDSLSADAVAQLRSDPDLLVRVLHHHMIAERLLTEQLASGELTTVAGDSIVVRAGASSLTVDGAAVVEPDIVAANGVVHGIDQLLLPADVDLSAPTRLAPASAVFEAGTYLLQGVVRSEVERSILVTAAVGAVGEANTTDELIVDADLGLPEATAQQLATLVAAVPEHLVSGTVSFDGEMLSVSGVYLDEAQRDAMATIAESVDATLDLTQQPGPSQSDAEQLEAELNAYVAENPLQFEPGLAVLDASAQPILDEIASRAQAFTGVVITVEGHTDSDGDAATNLELSQQRAEVVRSGLVERGLGQATVRAEGFGSAEPILVDGVEDKAASRRVEFRVEVA